MRFHYAVAHLNISVARRPNGPCPPIFSIPCLFVLWEAVPQTKYFARLKLKYLASQNFGLATPLHLRGNIGYKNALCWQQCFYFTHASFHSTWVTAIGSRCLVALPVKMSTFNSHVWQNIYTWSGPMKICCHGIVTQQRPIRTIRSKVSQPAFAGKLRDLVKGNGKCPFPPCGDPCLRSLSDLN